MINKKELHELFNGIANGEEAKFNLLYDKYSKLVYAIAFSILKNEENSKDIVQIVFTKIWKTNKEMLPQKNESTWIYTLTKNETLNFLRKQKNTINLEDIYYISEENEQLNEILSNDSYNRIISGLTEKEKEIVSLKIISNLSFKEISQFLGMPIGTIQWKYYKALHTLKILLTNLSMLVITITIYITQKTNKNKKSENISQINKNEEENSNTKLPSSNDEEIKNTEQSNKYLEKNENIIENQITENVAEENPIHVEGLDMGLFSLTSLFLIGTIIFSIIFIKHQQKVNKKVSK